MTFERHRRLRKSAEIRDMLAEVKVGTDKLMMPFFVIDGENKVQPIGSMPNIGRYTVDRLLGEIEKCQELGVKSVLLFGVPDAEKKDETGSESHNKNGAVQRAIREIKKKFPNMIVAADICLCEYTSHGHCGVVRDGEILNDETLPLLAAAALSCAKAGADIVAPSDMMDGHTAAIRETLDENGFQNTLIMAYSVKYASAFYGPFRDAASSAPGFGDRKTYQMDFRNRREALLETESDVDEGADILMVKPALPYLDIVRDVREYTDKPLAAYNVSGEYAMVKAAAANGWIDEKKIVTEILTAIRRAGADIIITYHAMDFARWQSEEK